MDALYRLLDGAGSVGKGAPPWEVGSAAELLKIIQEQPGSIGYIDAADLRPGVNVVAR